MSQIRLFSLEEWADGFSGDREGKFKMAAELDRRVALTGVTISRTWRYGIRAMTKQKLMFVLKMRLFGYVKGDGRVIPEKYQNHK